MIVLLYLFSIHFITSILAVIDPKNGKAQASRPNKATDSLVFPTMPRLRMLSDSGSHLYSSSQQWQKRKLIDLKSSASIGYEMPFPADERQSAILSKTMSQSVGSGQKEMTSQSLAKTIFGFNEIKKVRRIVRLINYFQSENLFDLLVLRLADQCKEDIVSYIAHEPSGYQIDSKLYFKILVRIIVSNCSPRLFEAVVNARQGLSDPRLLETCETDDFPVPLHLPAIALLFRRFDMARYFLQIPYLQNKLSHMGLRVDENLVTAFKERNSKVLNDEVMESQRRCVQYAFSTYICYKLEGITHEMEVNAISTMSPEILLMAIDSGKISAEFILENYCDELRISAALLSGVDVSSRTLQKQIEKCGDRNVVLLSTWGFSDTARAVKILSKNAVSLRHFINSGKKFKHALIIISGDHYYATDDAAHASDWFPISLLDKLPKFYS